ncbi:guanylate kinase [Alkalibacterium sp. 20]|uniref:guanylate kinase n=1 Tax=Alkalibacterium sp. 20 TaxID=1798803 RepID=UPI00090013F1|nr:AAA family ATPase [Alkalibacterium sp. 20]OJF93540.1 guanylate kinase [Alkalibacterium sp. 20]
MSGKRLIVLVGPSGSGKTTLGDELSKKGYPKLVTTTTRKPRPGETDGIDYYFKKEEELDPDDFVEQTIYNGNLYGLTKAEVREALIKFPLVHVSLDKNGAKALKSVYPEETFVVFICVSEEEMKKRMKARGDKEDKIAERIEFSQAINESEPIKESDLVIENKSVEKSVETILNTLKERNRSFK